jgi:hypothetical protein
MKLYYCPIYNNFVSIPTVTHLISLNHHQMKLCLFFTAIIFKYDYSSACQHLSWILWNYDDIQLPNFIWQWLPLYWQFYFEHNNGSAVIHPLQGGDSFYAQSLLWSFYFNDDSCLGLTIDQLMSFYILFYFISLSLVLVS